MYVDKLFVVLENIKEGKSEKTFNGVVVGNFGVYVTCRALCVQ